MKRVGLVKTCMIGALLSSVSWAVPGMQAQAADIPLKAPAADESPALWWFHGDVEVGGRDFLNDPQRDGNQVHNGSNDQNRQNLAKFYEYRDLRPGPFSNFWLSTGSNDGLYQIDLGGKNVGYDDQSYYLDASKAGQVYFNFDWDQTPHLYSTTAQTFYQGVGSTNLTLPPGFVRGTSAAYCRKHPSVSVYDRYWHQARHRVKSNSLDPGRCLGHQGRLLPYASQRHAG